MGRGQVPGVRLVRALRRFVGRDGPASFSALGEDLILRRHIEELGVAERYFVDIGAGDGRTGSNTFVFAAEGWPGASVEGNPGRFARLASAYVAHPNVRLARTFVTPDNVGHLLAALGVPREFGVFSLDIDSYDYYVLDAVLASHRPSLVCVEINEKIPPPIRFTVKYDPQHEYVGDHFFGVSISMLESLALSRGYTLLGLHYNNAFLAPDERARGKGVTAEQAYQTGYVTKPDRQQKFPYNKNVDHLLTLPPKEAAEEIRKFFARYAGKFELSV